MLEFDVDGIVERVRRPERMERFARQVLEDSEEFIPLDRGTLKGSGRAGVEPDGSGFVRWEAPYARALYRGERGDGEPLCYSTDKNPQARKEWFEAAKAKHGGWAALAGKLFGGGG